MAAQHGSGITASDFSAAAEEITRLRGEMKVLCQLLLEADDVIHTIEPENDDEHERLSTLKQRIHDALLSFQQSGIYG